MIGALWKPWFVHRPWQLVRRVGGVVTGTPARPVVVGLPWGVKLEVDPRETIGRAIWTTGIYDLAVSEALYRLTRPGDTVVDAGANIGYMTGLMAVRAGVCGRVVAFEPHPVVLERLRENVSRLTTRPGVAAIEVHPTGLSAAAGEAGLVEADDGLENHGLARIGVGEGGVRIRTERLDDVIGEGTVGVLKMDVEGHEAAVLAGAAGLLARKGIRCVVYEDHHGRESPVRRVLTEVGYRVYALGWRMRGPLLGDPNGEIICRSYEAPNYLAVTDPGEVEATFARPGWGVLR